MLELSPPTKNDEQHPLLKVETGSGDNGRTVPPIPSTGWSVTCSSKRSWCHRWPELFSACWMSGVLVGIFFLIICGLGTLGVIRRTPYYVINCNKTNPVNQVYYHYMVQEGGYVPSKKLSDLLIDVGMQYPELQFNILFLIDNTKRYHKSFYYFASIDKTLYELQKLGNLHLKHHNINVTIMPLTKYLATTPWKYNWKKIPMSNLLFYLRVYSVWKNGGISMQLDNYSLHYLEDPEIRRIWNPQNNLKKPEVYTFTRHKMNANPRDSYFSLFNHLLNIVLNDFFYKPMKTSTDYSKIDIVKSFDRTRYKREVIENKDKVMNYTISAEGNATEVENNTNLTIVDAPYRNTDHDFVINNNNTFPLMLETTQATDKTDVAPTESIFPDPTLDVDVDIKGVNNDSGSPQVPLIFVYDISIMSEAMESPYFPSRLMPSQLFPISNKSCDEEDISIPANPLKRNSSYSLGLALDGTFIAATSKQHPFLHQIILSACQRMPTRFVLQDLILTQCSTTFKDGVYCGDVYIV